MSSKIRLDDFSFGEDDLNDDLYGANTENRHKAKKPKKKKLDADDYSQQRSMKRRNQESHDFY